MKNYYFSILLLFFLPGTIVAQELVLNTELISNRQVSRSLFDSLAFRDLNFLIVGDDSPKEGLSYEYADDLSTLEASVYISKVNFLGVDFITADGDFSADSGVYFFDDAAGKKATISINFFGIAKYFRRFDPLFSKKDEIATLDKERSFANMRSTHRQAEYLIQLYSKYDTLVRILENQNGFTQLSESKKVKENLKTLKNEFARIFSDSIDKYKRKVSLQEYQISEKELKFNHKFIDKDDASISQNIATSLKGYRTNLIIEEISNLEKKIESIRSNLHKIEEEENRDVWNSKHILYAGASPYYGRESRNAYIQITNNPGYKFETVSRDIYGARFHTGYFIQSKSKYVSKFFALLSFDLGRSTNYDDLSVSTIQIRNQIAGNENVESITEKKAYEGSKPYEYAFKSGASLELYYWPWDRGGVFTSIGYENNDFELDELDNDKIPFRIGLLWDFKRADKSGKIAILQLFADRPDLNVHPRNDKEGLRFGLKVGIPINVKDKL
ncbi:hypothetical protein MKO06_15655 [Gramella sp. GC03-9]|uniref:Uncharacterized protein n=1 Tax=Christiangramia oceanisediminis TaxID=2920386 RepID=A0A9X2KZU0_9FLAO|nr:hypothetical protein [Gramella oceanisediminis]MCP9201345.1 hypothetical protein [Gramella oceanisediminis]